MAPRLIVLRGKLRLYPFARKAFLCPCQRPPATFHNKGSTVDDKGARQTTVAFENFYEFTGTGIQKFPIPSENPLDLARDLNALSQEWQKNLPLQLAVSFPLPQDLLNTHQSEAALYRQLATLRTDVPLQESLDNLEWQGAVRKELEEICRILGDPRLLDRVPRGLRIHHH